MSADNHKRGPRIKQTPQGDDRERLVCPDCQYIAYDNPKLVVGCLALFGEEESLQDRKLLLCRRAIEPRKNYWTLPAGFMELSETMQEGAAREAWEEARARLEMGPLISAYSVPHISQVHVFFLAHLIDEKVEAGEESLEVGLFKFSEIPWDEIAFPSVTSTIRHFMAQNSETIIPQTLLQLNSGRKNL